MRGTFLTAFLVAFLLAATDASAARGSRGGASRGGVHHGGGHFFRGPGVRSHTHIGFFFGSPFYSWPYLPYPGYAPLNSVPLAIEYIEKDEAARSPSDYWYFCPDSKTYYPYVKECPSGWQAVEPVTPPA